jgi:hypothetical protein
MLERRARSKAHSSTMAHPQAVSKKTPLRQMADRVSTRPDIGDTSNAARVASSAPNRGEKRWRSTDGSDAEEKQKAKEKKKVVKSTGDAVSPEKNRRASASDNKQLAAGRRREGSSLRQLFCFLLMSSYLPMPGLIYGSSRRAMYCQPLYPKYGFGHVPLRLFLD